ncbi:DUF2552 family protein [Metabacillus sediminilitoris]|uniref:DUF2552 domain-containing protein n=1 Tax=Metabacillus sediminilitoris TaxID=2567941 RepID=A0A4S4BYX9_9BACI|nr:DUF2552 family protein [Metabacillus sediminilitoris]QGQ47115.1 DUF2552 domain-containing protein [Metabacillus sediminilitoris]THF80460.1 DUF2552 domain-containing protein [Metabacillus sediminilitoris]
MKDCLISIKNVALNKTWVSFLNDNHPYSLLHWSIGGVHDDKKDVWLLQDEMSFEAQEFPTIDEAIKWMEENMEHISDVLG